MGKFIVGTFLILGFVFYELSGGSDFVPESTLEQIAEAETVAPDTVEVTRSNTATLVNVAAEAPDDAEIIQAVAEAVELDTTEEVAAAEPVIEEEPVAVETAPVDLRLVAGSRVNMRSGPGTTFDVLDTLDGGTQTEVIEVNAAGWARIRVTDTGQIGWMAERLLSES